MPVFLLKPDNFQFRVSMKIVHATNGPELLDRARASFQIPDPITIHIYTGARGYTNRSRLDTLDTFPDTDPSYAWLVLIGPRPTPVPPSRDPGA
jgi:hypothetical protein